MILESIIIAVYSVALLLIFMYALAQLNLLFNYLSARKHHKNAPTFDFSKDTEIPYVTIQLPVYNELYVMQRLLNNISEFVFSGIQILITKPSALKRIALNASKSEKNNLIFAELLSIATVKNRKGYGKILLNEFENEIEKNNKEKLPISLTTDLYANDKAIQFYKDSGYEILEIFDSYQNRKMCRFIKNNKKK